MLSCKKTKLRMATVLNFIIWIPSFALCWLQFFFEGLLDSFAEDLEAMIRGVCYISLGLTRFVSNYSGERLTSAHKVVCNSLKLRNFCVSRARLARIANYNARYRLS
ncbi:hypothetical protein F4604DRAFT_1168537 [Suillus subluteus]|nr:hypothetical protein F4604DRAFT_1168537 [Suillus subluteus]